MTNEEASIIVGNIPINGDECYTIPEYQQAKAMAIKALEQQPCEDAISRQAVLDTLDKMDKALDTDRTVENYKELLTECYKVLPSVGKDINVTTTDVISRKDMLAVFRQSNSLSQAWNGFEKLPPVTPKQQTCEDCISRAKAIEEADKLCLETGYDNEKVIEMLNDLPPVTPKEKSEYEHDHEVVKAYNDGQAYILDKIRAEIEQGYCKVENDYDKGRNMGLHIAMQIIDKYSEVSK